MLERDGYFTQLFGNDWLDPYLGLNRIAEEALAKKIGEILKADPLKFILDCWTWDERDRSRMIERLREWGADFVAAWNFVTAEDIVGEQYSKRFGSKIYFHSGRIKCQEYRRLPVTADQGFDEVVHINPHQLTLFPWADLIL